LICHNHKVIVISTNSPHMYEIHVFMFGMTVNLAGIR